MQLLPPSRAGHRMLKRAVDPAPWLKADPGDPDAEAMMLCVQMGDFQAWGWRKSRGGGVEKKGTSCHCL